MSKRAEIKAERQKRFKELKDNGAKYNEIMKAMGFKSSRTYYDLLAWYEGKEVKKRDATTLQYAPQREPKEVPVVIKGKRYIDVTSFFD